MDDMFFQCNKNAIYVLNTSYAYGEFGRLNLFGSPNSGVLASEEFYRSRSISGNSPLSDANTAKGSTTIQKLFHSSYDEKLPHHQQYHHSQHNHFQNPQTLAKCKTTTSTVMTAAKKGPALKSAIIAKKTKFWKYLEEEKWKKHSIENLSSTNCERDREEKLAKNNSTVSGNHTNNNNNNNNNINSSRGGPGTRNRNSDNQAKSSTELYREAAQLLGLSCTLCDNCRCLDCQSRYFECDDSDSFSEISFMGDYFDFPQAQQHKIEQNFTSCSPCRLQGTICSERDELDNCESFSELSIESPNANDEMCSTR